MLEDTQLDEMLDAVLGPVPTHSLTQLEDPDETPGSMDSPANAASALESNLDNAGDNTPVGLTNSADSPEHAALAAAVAQRHMRKSSLKQGHHELKKSKSMHV